MQENNDKGLIIRQLMTYGAILGSIMVVYSIIIHLTGRNGLIPDENTPMWANLRVVIVGLGIYYSVRHLADKILKQRLSFLKFVFFGICVGFFYSIIESCYFVIYINYISPQTKELMIQIAQKQLIEMNISNYDEEYIRQIMNRPIAVFFGYLFSGTFGATLYSLIFGLLYTLMGNFASPKK